MTGFVSLTPTHTDVVVTTSSAEVLAANAARKHACFENVSDTLMYLKLGVAAVEEEGIALAANGGSFVLSPSEANHYTGAVYGIRAAGVGDKTLLITEGT